ncbi:MAG: hypothetical protein QOF55_681 [Thermoleophilaceae bacterium]|nr:hypothetical protein [Thermoleophilaceae bacterium]
MFKRRCLSATEFRELMREDTLRFEMIAEGRAGRQALFRILERLDGGGGAAPAG